MALSAMRARRRYVLVECDPRYVAIANLRIGDFKKSKYMRFLQQEDGGMSLTPDELTVLTEVPVPQADNLDIVFDVPQMVKDGADTRSKIANSIGYVDRQGPYYADAAMALRLVEIAGSYGRRLQRLEVTPLGAEYCTASESERASLRRRTVLSSPIVKYVSSELGITRNGEPAAFPVHPTLLDESAVASVLERLDLARDTAGRRAHTLCGWLEVV